MLHQRVRREWGYGADEQLSMDDLIHEALPRHPPGRSVIRRAPDHTREADALRPARRGRALRASGLTESLRHARRRRAVSGLYFAHPEARYFAVGKIGRDQVEAYAKRRGVDVAQVERALSSVLGY